MEMPKFEQVIPIKPYEMLSALLASLLALDGAPYGDGRYHSQIDACAAGLDEVIETLTPHGLQTWTDLFAISIAMRDQWAASDGR